MNTATNKIEAIQHRVETWIRDQRARIFTAASRGPFQWKLRWWPPWNNGNEREQRKWIQEEYERQKKRLLDLCSTVKAESVADLQDILCAMVLSECVYKRPASEMVRAVNKFKADFGGQFVSLERVQPSADHVLHRYLLAEAGDTLFASFIGTKQYKDVMTDANILQGTLFHEDPAEASSKVEATKSSQGDIKNGKVEYLQNSTGSKPKQLKDIPKPAVHRGFLARAKGIPALELYRLAQKKKRKLVLCGHSLGGAVAALATLAILRVVAATSLLKEDEKVQIKCITFSQPPVGNAVLKDYVHKKGWQHYFKSYCIPEDLVPRILSPAYFHHYNEQSVLLPDQAKNSKLSMTREDRLEGEKVKNVKDNEGEQLVLGMGPVQSSFWRLSRLVPLEGVRRQLNKYSGKDNMVETPSATNLAATPLVENDMGEPQSLEIQEGLDDVSLKPLSDTENGSEYLETIEKRPNKNNTEGAGVQKWGRVPYFPQYVPFGQLYLLENSSVELLSGSEYSKLISVKSVIAELKERFQSHSMRSYRSRFQRIFDLCMNDDASSFLGAEQQQQLLHLQQWLGLTVGGAVELGHIVESPIIRTATTIAPLGWRGIPGEKNAEPLKVDITGFGLHLCTLVHAQVNGNWCSTTVESFPSAPSYTSNDEAQPELQKLRVFVGAPLRRPPIVADSAMSAFPSVVSEILNKDLGSYSSQEEKNPRPAGLNNVSVFCTSDFATVSKEVHVRTRRVRLLGLEGAGKTSLFKAVLGQGSLETLNGNENLLAEGDIQEGIVGGLCYCDAAGVNLQELHSEASRFRDELWRGIRNLSQKTDLIVLVHNLSHKIPRYNHSNTSQDSQQKPALSLLLEEAKALGIPWVLAITNKFSVSAHQQRTLIDTILQAYQASPSTTGVINSCPYVMPIAGSLSMTRDTSTGYSDVRVGAQKFLFAPIDLVRRPFLKKDTVLPVEGVDSFCQLVHGVLRSYEETALKELANDRLLAELAREHGMALRASRDSQDKAISAAAVGASLGAGLGVVLAVVMGAASALRKP